MKQILILLALFAFCRADLISDCLIAHNNNRTALGLNNLTWSPTLAASAQAWSDSIAYTQKFAHSGTGGVGENLAGGTAWYYTTPRLIQLWTDEKIYFTPGIFPDISTTGKWDVVGHYSQVVWRSTTQVGCGLSLSSNGNNYLVCQYYPAGNVKGSQVY